MKILLINKFHYNRGGSETYYFALADALIAKGHEVIFFSMYDDKNVYCEQEKYFVSNTDYVTQHGLMNKVKIGLKLFYSYESQKNIECLIQKEKPDIAHIGLIHRQITFSIVDSLKKYKIPIVMTMHDLIFTCPCCTMLRNGEICELCMSRGLINCIRYKCIKESTVKSILGSLEKKFLDVGKFYNKIDLYIAECGLYKNLMIKSGFTNSRIIHMTNFLPINQEYNFSPNYKDYILYFGRFSREKGILTLLKAHKKLNCKYKLILVGNGPMQDELENFISTNQLTNIEMPGAIYDKKMEKIIEEAKTIIVPSEWYENCPYSLLQAIAKGKIVIASRMGGLPELINDNVTGYLFEPGDAIDLSNKIAKVMAMDKEMYKNISLKISEEAKKKHHWESYINRLLIEYNNLLSRSKKQRELS